MLTVYGRKSSSNVQKVLWCCGELALPVDRVDMGREFGGNKEPSYLALNPNGLVPTIVEEDGFSMWESNAIIRYLARRDPQKLLIAADPRAEAVGEQWMDWQLSALGVAFTPLFHGLVRHSPEDRNWDEIEKGREETHRCLAMLDRRLQTSAYVAGDKLTFADIPLGIYAYRWFAFNIERRPLPALTNWYQRLTEREPFRTHVMVGLA